MLGQWERARGKEGGKWTGNEALGGYWGNWDCNAVPLWEALKFTGVHWDSQVCTGGP